MVFEHCHKTECLLIPSKGLKVRTLDTALFTDMTFVLQFTGSLFEMNIVVVS